MERQIFEEASRAEPHFAAATITRSERMAKAIDRPN